MARVLEGAQRRVDRLAGILLIGCSGATIALVAAIAVVIAASVFWRYVLNDALSWSEEVSKYCMVWMTFTGAPIALARGGHIAIELLPQSLPDRARHALMLLVAVIVVALMAILVWRGATFAWNGRTQVMITVGNVSMFWLFVSVPVGAAIMLVVALGQGLLHLRGLLDPLAVRAEEGRAAGQPAAGPA